MAGDNDPTFDESILERAQELVHQVTVAARAGDAENVLDQIDEIIDLYQEFPDTVWDACVLLTRSRESTVRIAMATRGLPKVYNEVNPFFALKLAGYLSQDSNPAVAEAMRDYLQNLYDPRISA
jgi:hypothetical protein